MPEAPYAHESSRLLNLEHPCKPLLQGGRHQRGFRVLLEYAETLCADVDGEDHAVATVAPGSVVGLLAVEVARNVDLGVKLDQLCLCERDVIWVGVPKVGVDERVGLLEARLVEGGLGQGVVGPEEVELDLGTLLHAVEEWRVVLEIVRSIRVEASRDGHSVGGDWSGNDDDCGIGRSGGGSGSCDRNSDKGAILLLRIRNELIHLVARIDSENHTLTAVVGIALLAVEPQRLVGSLDRELASEVGAVKVLHVRDQLGIEAALETRARGIECGLGDGVGGNAEHEVDYVADGSIDAIRDVADDTVIGTQLDVEGLLGGNRGVHGGRSHVIRTGGRRPRRLRLFDLACRVRGLAVLDHYDDDDDLDFDEMQVLIHCFGGFLLLCGAGGPHVDGGIWHLDLFCVSARYRKAEDRGTYGCPCGSIDLD